MKSPYTFDPTPPRGVPVAGSEARFPVRRIHCVGRNYAAHALEMGGRPDREPPFFFSKPGDAVVASGASVPYPLRTENFHHEIELVVAIGTRGRAVTPAHALDLVFGYAVGIDLTRRDLQAFAYEQHQPWDVAKGFDRAAPVGTIAPVAEAGHPRAGRIWLAVNGQIRQDSDLADMIWQVPEILAELSTYYVLEPGDLVFTGTPAGVGPLEPGDTVTGGIEGVGSIDLTIDP